jgi:hypothetical protein
MMTGRVKKIEEGAVHLDLEKGMRCWFDPMDECTIEVGDVVTGNLWSYDVLELFNVTRGKKMRVFMQGHTGSMVSLPAADGGGRSSHRPRHVRNR